MTLKFDGWSRKIIGHLFYTTSSLVHHFKSIGDLNLKLQSGNAQFRSKLAIFVPCDLKIWWMTLKNFKAPFLYYSKLCASFQSHGWIRTGVTVRKRSIRVKVGNLLSPVTLKFAGWPWKSIWHLFYVASSVVHHFIAISEFKLELQSGNTQFGSKSMISFSRVTSKFDRWPSKTIGRLLYATSSFVHHFIAIGVFKLELQSGNAQSGTNSTIFSRVTLKFDGWPWQAIGHLF